MLMCLTGCGGGTANNGAGAGNSVEEASAANAVAPPADLAAAAADNALTLLPPPDQAIVAAETGPCPFEVRNLVATSGGADDPEGGVSVIVERRSADNREGTVEARRNSAAPVLALDLRSGPPLGNTGWTRSAFGIGPLPAGFTTVILYCHGTEIARGPVRRAGD